MNDVFTPSPAPREAAMTEAQGGGEDSAPAMRESVEALSDDSRVTIFDRIKFSSAVFALGVVFYSVTICALTAAMHAAAWFAFLGDVPPFPWPLLRFFLALGWVVSFVIAVFAFFTTPPETAS